jgi:hypothetical protein
MFPAISKRETPPKTCPESQLNLKTRSTIAITHQKQKNCARPFAKQKVNEPEKWTEKQKEILLRLEIMCAHHSLCCNMFTLRFNVGNRFWVLEWFESMKMHWNAIQCEWKQREVEKISSCCFSCSLFDVVWGSCLGQIRRFVDYLKVEGEGKVIRIIDDSRFLCETLTNIHRCTATQSHS